MAELSDLIAFNLFLFDNPGLTVDRLAENYGCSDKTIKRYLEPLMASGLVSEEEDHGRAVYYVVAALVTPVSQNHTDWAAALERELLRRGQPASRKAEVYRSLIRSIDSPEFCEALRVRDTVNRMDNDYDVAVDLGQNETLIIDSVSSQALLVQARRLGLSLRPEVDGERTLRNRQGEIVAWVFEQHEDTAGLYERLYTPVELRKWIELDEVEQSAIVRDNAPHEIEDDYEGGTFQISFSRRTETQKGFWQ